MHGTATFVLPALSWSFEIQVLVHRSFIGKPPLLEPIYISTLVAAVGPPNKVANGGAESPPGASRAATSRVVKQNACLPISSVDFTSSLPNSPHLSRALQHPHALGPSSLPIRPPASPPTVSLSQAATHFQLSLRPCVLATNPARAWLSLFTNPFPPAAL